MKDMTGSSDKFTIFADIVVVQYQEQAYTPSHTYTLRSIMGDNFQREIKLLPVRVHHVENARELLPIL